MFLSGMSMNNLSGMSWDRTFQTRPYTGQQFLASAPHAPAVHFVGAGFKPARSYTLQLSRIF